MAPYTCTLDPVILIRQGNTPGGGFGVGFLLSVLSASWSHPAVL